MADLACRMEETAASDRYKVLGKLGAGGMAAVYRALDSHKNSEIALKTFTANSDFASEVKLFRREHTILSKLNHPNIVKVFDFHEDNGQAKFAMELVEGEPLSERLKRDALSKEESYRLLIMIAETLAYIHSQGVLYCDLSSRNIMFSKKTADTPERPIIIDFGISRFAGEYEAKTSTAGTDYYMSPEQLRGESLDEKTDIYSFGILGFELLTGQRPYSQEKSQDIAAAHLTGEVPMVRKFSPEVPYKIERLIAICMEKQKKHRYDTMHDVAARLKELTTQT